MTAPYQPLKPSILDRIAGRLFPSAQQFDPSVARQGLLQLGANLMQAGGASPAQQGTLANIGAAINGVDIGALTERAMAMQAYRQQQAVQAQIGEIAGRHPAKAGETPDQVYDRIASMVSELAGRPGTEDLLGKLSNVLAQLRPHKEARARYVFKNINEGKGKWGYYRLNQDDPEDRIRISDGTPPPGVSDQRADKLKASALLALAENALPALEEATPPSAIESVLGSPLGQKFGGQAFLKPERQLANQAGTQFSDAILRFTSGANTPEPEVQRYLGYITPRYGDAPELRERKLSAQRAIVGALRRAAGQDDEVDPNAAVSIIVEAAQPFSSGGVPRAPGNPFRK